MAGYFDGVTYTFCPTLADLVDKIVTKRNRSRVIFAHNGGRFDFYHLMEYLRSVRGVEVKMIVQGSRIVALKIRHGKQWITLQDSISLFGASSPQSLDKLCDTFKPATRKMRGAIDFEKERVDKGNPLHRDYLEADCRSLWEILDKYRRLPYIDRIGFKVTVASTAMAAWRTTLKDPIRVTSTSVQEFCREAYAGGRVEIFRQVMGSGACYDKNSLFPAMMLRELPVERKRASNNWEEFGFHDVTVEVPECYIPILWKKTPKLIFPTGTFRGTFFSEELKLAVECGARILRHHRGEHFSSSPDLFRELVESCYRLRLDNPGTSLDLLGKMIANNVYGKTGEREEKKGLEKVDPGRPSTWPKEFRAWHSEEMFQKTGLVEIVKRVRHPHMLVHIAAAVTAHARVEMARTMLLPYQDSIRYTDTDSGFVAREDLPTSTALGEWKREYLIKRGFFLLPKGYWIEIPERDENNFRKFGGKIIKLKGFSKRAFDSITYKMFRSGNISHTEEKLVGFRTALLRKNSYLAVLPVKKSVISQYSKRKILAGGETRPWDLTTEGKLR